MPSSSVAQTWLAAPATNIWNTAGNWLPANVPDTAGETATFTDSAITNPTIIGPIEIDGIIFNGATAFIVDNQDLATISGPGLSNSSGLIQTIDNSQFISQLNFENNATIGNAIVITNAGLVFFDDDSSAGVGTVTNTTSDGVVTFLGNATGGSATLDNAGSGAPNGSTILFSGASNAGSATITNSGTNSLLIFSGNAQGGTSTISNTGAGSSTQFSVDSNALNAAITNLADTTTFFTDNASAGSAQITSSGDFSTVSFNDNSTGGTSTINSSGNFSSVSFNDNSTGGTTTINLSGGIAIGEFKNNATAGAATINLTNATALLDFFDSSKGGTSTINNSASSGTFPAGVVAFFNTSDAENAVITNSGQNSQTLFSDTATAGAATIVNSGDDSNTQFIVSATGGTANITNSGIGSSTGFAQNTNAGAATIISSGDFTTVSFIGNSNGGTANITLSGGLAIGEFQDNATAGDATINLTGADALLNFFDSATGGTSEINNDLDSVAFPSSVVGFFNTSNAQNAVINNSGENSQTLISDTATAGAATINNIGVGSNTTFIVSATGGTANITNSGTDTSTIFGQNTNAGGATIISSGDFSNVRFIGNSSAGTSTITLSGGLAIGDFLDNATADDATINLTGVDSLLNFFDSATGGTSEINNDLDSVAFPSSVVGFFNTSNAQNAVINNSGENSQTLISDTATAGAATIVNSGDDSNTQFIASATASTANITNSGVGSSTGFAQNTNAGNSTIISSGDFSTVSFIGDSSGGTSTIILSGNTAVGEFLDNATAGDATINLTSATALLNFLDGSNAGTATINNGGSGGAPSSVVGFFGTSSAQNAVITNSGTNSQTLFSGTSNASGVTVTNTGAGSATVFSTNATGGSAVLINANPTSSIDISSLLSSSLTIGSFEGNGTLFLGSQTLTAGGNNRDITFSGIIRDGGVSGGTGGGLVKVGTGTWTLTGANTYTGGTDLQLGTIVVANPQALGLGNFRLSNGVLRVGGGTSDIRVGGNYTQTGGELQLRIGGTGAGEFDRLAVVGSADLGGRLRLDTINGYTPQDGDQIAVVTAGGGVNGEFANVQTAAPLVEGQLQYLADEVVLSFLRTAFIEIAKTPNQRATAKALDQAVLNPDAAELLAYLDSLPIESLPGALDRLAPEELGAIFSIARSAANTQAFTVLHRLDEIRAASRSAMLDPVLGGPAKEMKELMPEEPPRAGVFIQGSGEFVNVGNTTNARGYDFDAGGVTIGGDYKVTDNFVTGFLVNYTRARLDLTRSGRIEADSIRGGVYASVFGGGGYLSAYVGGGYNSYDTKRDGLQGKAKGSPDGGEFNALIAAGYDAHVGGLTVGPIATWQYTYSQVDGFRERGSLAPLDVRSQDSQSSRTNVGIRLAYEVPMGAMLLTPEVRATWQHEFGDRSFATTSQFGFGGPNFSVHTPEIGRDSLALTTGFTLQLSQTFGAHAFYYGEFGTSNYDSHNVYLGARMSF